MSEQTKKSGHQGKDHGEKGHGGAEQAKKAGAQAREQAEQIARQGRNVRDRIRRLFVEVVEKQKLDFEQMQKTARQVVDGAADGVRRAVPDDPEGVLRDVVHGLADGLGTATEATRSAFSNALDKGQRFTREEVDKTVKGLQNLEKQFVETVSTAAREVSDQVKTQASDLTATAKQAIADVRPSIESALKAARQDPVKLASESVKAGVEASRQTAGLLAQTVSGLLRGAGDVLAHVGDTIEGSGKGSKESKEGKASGKSDE